MQISNENIELFYKLHPALILYTNQKHKILNDINSIKDIQNQPIENIYKIRSKLFENADIIIEFIEKNPFNFDRQELNIIKTWKYFKKGKFIIVKHLKKYSVFLSEIKNEPEKLYGVLGLTTSLEEMFPKQILPFMVDAILLPFKNVIIYDGLFNHYNIHFGGNYSRTVRNTYNLLKAKYGIITNLLEIDEKDETDSDKELIKFYLKNEDNYSEELHNLIMKTEENLIFYHQEIARSNLKYFKNKLNYLNIKGKIWIAAFDDVLLSISKDKNTLNSQLKSIISKDKFKFLFIKNILLK